MNGVSFIYRTSLFLHRCGQDSTSLSQIAANVKTIVNSIIDYFFCRLQLCLTFHAESLAILLHEICAATYTLSFQINAFIH